jgi:hypothetical protein
MRQPSSLISCTQSGSFGGRSTSRQVAKGMNAGDRGKEPARNQTKTGERSHSNPARSDAGGVFLIHNVTPGDPQITMSYAQQAN